MRKDKMKRLEAAAMGFLEDFQKKDEAAQIEKTLRWLETVGGEDHPVGIKKDVAKEIARLARLGLQTEAVLDAENVQNQLAIQSTNSWVGYSILRKALITLRRMRTPNQETCEHCGRTKDSGLGFCTTQCKWFVH